MQTNHKLAAQAMPDWPAIAAVVLGVTAFSVAQGVTYPLISLVLAFLATLYPSWRASRVKPAEALRYE